jgi:hypothetical protein
MQEVVKAIQEEVDVPLCINGVPEMIEAGLKIIFTAMPISADSFRGRSLEKCFY